MGFEKRDYSHSSVHGVVIPVPQSPLLAIYSQITLSTPQAITWGYTIPPNDMVYNIVNFSCFCSANIFLLWDVKLNYSTIWGEYRDHNIRWTPGVPSSYKITAPDHLSISLVYPYALSYTVYWEMDFWQEPIH